MSIDPISIDTPIEKLINRSEAEEEWTMLVTGDVMLGRTVNYQTLKYGDFKWAFSEVAETLSQADLTFINLESPLVEDCPVKNDGMIFCGDVRHTEGLVHAGIDAASLANNHAMNYGRDGLADTIQALESANIIPVGVENPKYYQVYGVNVALLGYDDVECYGNGVACADDGQIIEDIQIAKQNADIAIVMFHWGPEYTSAPSKRQKELAYLSVDAGADIVLGNHPHWVQPEEVYKDKLIVYSHGNFIFDQMWSLNTRRGVLGEYKFKGDKLISYRFIPVEISDYGIVRLLEND